MKIFSSICLSLPWWYVLATNRELTAHESSFLAMNGVVTVVSMIHRSNLNKYTLTLDVTAICAMQFHFHFFSELLRPLLLGFMFHRFSKVIYVLGVLGLALKGKTLVQQGIMFGTILFSSACHVNEEDDSTALRWLWHFSNGLLMLYPFVFNLFD